MPEEQTKIDVEPLEMGVEIKLNKKMGDKGKLKDILSQYIKELLAREEKTQRKLERNLKRWNKQFRGIKKKKTIPYEGCSNVAVPLTRTYTEAVLYRLMDAIFSQKKVWMVRTLDPNLVTPEDALQIEDALDWWQKYVINLRKKVFSPLMQSVKIGTGALYFDYVRKQRLITKYATDKEKNDKKTKKILPHYSTW